MHQPVHGNGKSPVSHLYTETRMNRARQANKAFVNSVKHIVELDTEPAQRTAIFLALVSEINKKQISH